MNGEFIIEQRLERELDRKIERELIRKIERQLDGKIQRTIERKKAGYTAGQSRTVGQGQ